MKLLSRFIWLIIAILAIVFVGISIVHFRAENKFKLIKTSISQEYNLLIDKMLSPERSEIFTTFNYGICNSSTTGSFLMQPSPIPELLKYDLDPMVMNHFNVDAVWFFKTNGDPFYFFSPQSVDQKMLSINANEIKQIFKNEITCNFYLSANKQLFRVFGSKVGDIISPKGYVFSASLQDNRWTQLYEKEINNSEISFSSTDEMLPPISKEIIRIERSLLSFDGSTAQNLVITLKLPFLKLWQSTTSTDNWLMIGAMLVIVYFLILSLLFWVISPLKRISRSLEKGNSYDIQPLLKNNTEMGNVARMIGDYHLKTEELESSESIKRHIIEQAQVGIIIAEASSNLIITANPYACELINAPEDAILGNVTNNFLEPLNDSQADLLKNQNINIEGFESKLFNSKGNEIPILRTITHIFMDGRQVQMETFVDLSEIKGLQGKLEEEKKKLSLAVKNSGLIFCEYEFKTDELVISEDWKFLFKGNNANNAQNFIENIYPSDVKKITDQFDSLSSGIRDTLTVEFRVKHPERGIIWINVSVLITKRDESGKPKQLIGLLEDITERITVQQELIKAKEKAEESDRTKSAYLGNMSHKIRTPLNAIVGFANLLTEEELGYEEKSNFINIIRHDTEQVLHLIDDIINIAKIDANQLDVNVKTCSANDMINNLSEYYKTNEKTNKIKFNIKTMLPNGKDILQTDPDKLKQIMDSLLNNAFKFTEEGKIELGYFINPVDQKLIFYVKDTGIGIPDEHKDKIFNRFFQVNLMTEGTGLGLTISNSLVKLLNGKLYFDSKVKEGSTFYVELPFHEV
jgi:signal transduction histidine kinase